MPGAPAGRPPSLSWRLTWMAVVAVMVVDAAIVLNAFGAEMVRCADGWTNLGQWFVPRVLISIVCGLAVVVGGVLVIADDPSRRLIALLTMAIGVTATVVTLVSVYAILRSRPYGACFD